MVFLGMLIVALILMKRPRATKEVDLLYGRGEIVNNVVVFPCGCCFDWVSPQTPPRLCAAHKAIMAEAAR